MAHSNDTRECPLLGAQSGAQIILDGDDVLGEPGLQRLEPPDGPAHLVGERRTIQLDAMPGEDLALPIICGSF